MAALGTQKDKSNNCERERDRNWNSSVPQNMSQPTDGAGQKVSVMLC